MSSGPCLWECLPASFLQWCYTSSTIHAGLKNCSIFHLSILFVALSNFSHISKHPSCSCYLHSALTVCHISLDPSSKLSSFNTGCHVYSLHPLAEQRWLSTESQALRQAMSGEGFCIRDLSELAWRRARLKSFLLLRDKCSLSFILPFAFFPFTRLPYLSSSRLHIWQCYCW